MNPLCTCGHDGCEACKRIGHSDYCPLFVESDDRCHALDDDGTCHNAIGRCGPECPRPADGAS